MTTYEPGAFAALGMYPFVPLIGAWDRLYATVASTMVGAPTTLRWDLDPHDTWLSPQLVVGQTCGWPLVTALRDRVRPIGAFVHILDGAPNHIYRSVIVSHRDTTLEDLWGSRAAINSVDSLSGNISLLASLPGAHPRWPGEVVWTGAHVASIEAVRTHAADVASIDGQTWAFLQRDAPNLIDGLVVIGRGPRVPHLPLILPAGATDESVAEWRSAFAEAVRSASLSDALDTLMIEGFVALDLSDYDEVLAPLVATQPVEPQH